MAKAKVTGMKEITRNLERHIDAIQAGAFSGTAAAATHIKKLSQQRVPVRVGNLRASAFVMTGKGEAGSSGDFKEPGAAERSNELRTATIRVLARITRDTRLKRITAGVGYGAIYASFVHGLSRAGAAGFDPDKDVKGRRAELVHSAVGGSKFLENPVKENTGTIFNIIKQHAKIKGTL